MPTWTGRTPPNTTYDKPRDASYLLNEDGTYLLNEDGTKFLLQESEFANTEYTKRTEPTTAWTTRTIPS